MDKSTTKKNVFSGMQPSGLPTLGNYLGAMKNWIKLQDDYNCLYCIVDMHSITVKQAPLKLRANARELTTLYIAAGLDPSKSIIYYQSHVTAHAELAWILSCFTYMGELNRMTQFKEKSSKYEQNINVGLFTYPVLMAADILLFKTDLVPVGEDQKQHLELCRDIAERFNNIYGNIFTIPNAYIGESGKRIMDLQQPNKKMSKTENENSTIFLLDEPDIIMNKVKRAVTDSENLVKYSEEKHGISNLINIYTSITGKSIEETESIFKGIGYNSFKTAVGEAIVEELKGIQDKFYDLNKNKDYIDKIIQDGCIKAKEISYNTLKKVKKKVGYPL